MNVKKDNYYLGNVFAIVDGDNYIECEFADMSEDAIDEVDRQLAVK